MASLPTALVTCSAPVMRSSPSVTITKHEAAAANSSPNAMTNRRPIVLKITWRQPPLATGGAGRIGTLADLQAQARALELAAGGMMSRPRGVRTGLA